MDLYLMRHGLAAERGEAPGPDEERPLTLEGIARTRQMARALEQLGVAPNLVLTSGLRRAAQTADLALKQLGGRRRTTASLTPGSPPQALLDEVAGLDGPVLCVGHSPHLELVIALAAAGTDSPICELKKAGVARLDLEPVSRRATLVWLLQPGVVRKLT